MKYYIERSTYIEADMSTVRALVEDFSQWNSWSPWTIIEPDCTVEVEGGKGEIGHTMSWDGEIIGSGTNTLIENSADKLSYDLRFIKPFKSQANTGFVFEEVDGKIKVTWFMDSSMPFFLFFMIKPMKAWIGMDYDRGLRMLKEMAEKGEVKAKTVNNGVVDIKGFSYVGIQRTVPMKDISEVMPKDFDTLIGEFVIKRGKSAQNWVSLYPKMDMGKMEMTYIAAISDEGLVGEDIGPEFVRGEVKSSRALEIKHDGPYDFIGNAWSMGMMYLRAKKMKQKGYPFEQYWNSPKEVSPAELKTSIYFPLKN